MIAQVRARNAWSFVAVVAKGLLCLTIAAILLIGASLTLVETQWGKEQIRSLVLRQANRRLAATLEIGRLGGSLLRGVELQDVKVLRNGEPIITIHSVSVRYTLRDLLRPRPAIRNIRVEQPRIVLVREPDGRWNLPALVGRDEKPPGPPGRGFELSSIEVVDATVVLKTAVTFGAVHIPTSYERVNGGCSYFTGSGRWRIAFKDVSFQGSAPDLLLTQLNGAIDNGPAGLSFEQLSVITPQTSVVLNGTIHRERKPTELDLRVRADRFAFQEWSGVLAGLAKIAVVARFEAQLQGPLSRLDTRIALSSASGSANGRVALDTTVPGWAGTGSLELGHLDLAGWLSRPDKPSDITGRVTFDLALELGRHFPTGSYVFEGPHAEFIHYAGTNVRLHGTVTRETALVAAGTASAYGANVTISSGSIGINDPFPYHFEGTAAGVDLTKIPPSVPVPHVESRLDFAYDISGAFGAGSLAGRARFTRSVFLGATVQDGTVGTLDTTVTPSRYSGSGTIEALDVHRLGVGLGVALLQQPRYSGRVSGNFHVDGSGFESPELTISATGHLDHAEIFGGRLFDADLGLDIHGGTVEASYDGRFHGFNPAIPLGDPRFDASITGSSTLRAVVRDLLIRTPGVNDFDIQGRAALASSVVGGIALDSATLNGSLHNGITTVAHVDLEGPAIQGSGAGTFALADDVSASFEYDVVRLDASQFSPLFGHDVRATIATKGRLTGPLRAPSAAGHATAIDIASSGMNALNADVDYAIAFGQAPGASIQAAGSAGFVSISGRSLREVTGKVALNGGRLDFDLQIHQSPDQSAGVTGAVQVDLEQRQIAIADFSLTLGSTPWHLIPAGQAATLRWDEHGWAIAPMVFQAGGHGEQRIELGGTWLYDGTGSLKLRATDVRLDTLAGVLPRSVEYGGVLAADATVRGTRLAPIVDGSIEIAQGRVGRVPYERLAGRIDYSDGMFDVHLRVDQTVGTFLTADGTVPLSLFDRRLSEQPIDVAIVSSPVSLGLLEGLTDVVRDVSGSLTLDVKAVGTSRDPHFAGVIGLDQAAFTIASTNVRYKNARASVTLERDRAVVNVLHVEDDERHALDLKGSLGTRELRAGDLSMDISARHFDVLHNELGTLSVNAQLALSGDVSSPVLTGDLTLQSGTVRADAVIERAFYQPYQTESTPVTSASVSGDVMTALNPWDRMALDVALHFPENLRMSGAEVQLAPGTPIGIDSINLRAGGDIWLEKDAGQPLAAYGWLDSVSGTFSFQGRQFDVQPPSSINFSGPLSPDLYLTVGREISGVQTRVSINGPLSAPELGLSSTPPLEASDILSLIVFNTSANTLSSLQQQQLVVRAGALAAGFVAAPILSELERAIGLDVLSVEPGSQTGVGPKVTIGQELAPGLVARFSRQFGAEQYDEALVEYYLSRILELRATFSDVGSPATRSPFLSRTERAGIDLLFFFSF